MHPSQLIVWLAQALLCLGVYGMLTRRHAIALLLCVELILNAAALNFVLFGRLFGHVQGQAVALFIIALAACEAAAGLAIVIALSRFSNTIWADQVQRLHG